MSTISVNGRWVFREHKLTRCVQCGEMVERSWNYFVGSTIKRCLCEQCVETQGAA